MSNKVYLFLSTISNESNAYIIEPLINQFEKAGKNVKMFTYSCDKYSLGENICHQIYKQNTNTEDVKHIKKLSGEINRYKNCSIFIDVVESCSITEHSFGTYGGIPYLCLVLLEIDILLLHCDENTSINFILEECRFFKYMKGSQIVLLDTGNILGSYIEELNAMDIKVFSREGIDNKNFYEYMMQWDVEKQILD